MLNIFGSSNLYVKIYRNEIEVTYLQDDVTIRQQAARTFSTNRMLVADFHAAEENLKTVIKAIPTGRRLFDPSHVFLMQHMIDLGGGICEVEKRALRDLAYHAGAKDVFIISHTEALSTEHAMHKIMMGLKGGAFMPPDLSG